MTNTERARRISILPIVPYTRRCTVPMAADGCSTTATCWLSTSGRRRSTAQSAALQLLR
jgi:hypothetical protein